MLLRLDKNERSSFDDVRDSYMESQLTRARVPLRAIADVKPEWQTSRIVRRNGVRTLTVRGFVKKGFYGSALLDAVAPKIAALKLPPGYRIYYGGEKFNQDDNMPQLLAALGSAWSLFFLCFSSNSGTSRSPSSLCHRYRWPFLVQRSDCMLPVTPSVSWHLSALSACAVSWCEMQSSSSIILKRRSPRGTPSRKQLQRPGSVVCGPYF